MMISPAVVLSFVICLLSFSSAGAQGIPRLRNYLAEDYHAHNFNFDIKTGVDGMVFVANFEGLLYYDHVDWHTIHTPGYTRVTVVYRDQKDSIWVGGYNYIGKVRCRANGQPYLHRVGRADAFQGEVQEIKEYEGQLYFAVNDGKVYMADGENIIAKREFNKDKTNIGLFDIVNLDAMIEGDRDYLRTDTTQVQALDNGLYAVIRKDKGLLITDSCMQELYVVNENNGLCSNAVVWVDYDGKGCLWGATENGIFSLSIPSSFSYFTNHEGLRGEVLCMMTLGRKMYVGTNGGLFEQNGMAFSRVGGISHACWALATTAQGLAAATANGIWIIPPSGPARQLSTNSTTALLAEGLMLYSGEMDGVWQTDLSTNSRTKICRLEKVSKIVGDHHGTIWLQNIHGEVWRKKAGDSQFEHEGNQESIATIVQLDGETVTVGAESDSPFPYPRYAYTDPRGVTWLTSPEGTGLYCWKNGRRTGEMAPQLHALRGMNVRAVMTRNQEVWIGSDQGLTIVNTAISDPALRHEPRLLIRSVTLDGDSILWGGFGTMPEVLPTLGSNDLNLRFTFSLDYLPMAGETLYRYRLDNGAWSAWTEKQDADYLNLHYGSHTFEVQAVDPFGRETGVTTVRFSVAYPFYMRWYMNLFYLLLVALLIYALMRLRLQRLEHDKQRLEQIVEERTEEVRSAHQQLVKQERLATVGKLTQGLIDRILNPLNYINNFAKLSEGLVRDVKANIDDEKEHISEDNYEDTIEVLDMLRCNLQKVEEHGQNTSRIVKAMEEVLRDRHGGIVKTDLIALVRQIEKTWKETPVVKPSFDYPDTSVFVMVNPELLSKVFKSLLTNSVYAIEKRKEKSGTPDFQPELTLRVSLGENASVTIRDNGIGIEEKIIDKIFDPFFTTKTTGEASGIGLYLSSDIIQNYGGQITVESVKDEHTTFTVILPVMSESGGGDRSRDSLGRSDHGPVLLIARKKE